MTTYMTGEPCRNGHIAPRYVHNGRCVECKAAKDRRNYERTRAAKMAKSRAWYAANREENIAVKRAYHARMKDDPEYQAKRRAYMQEHRERLAALRRAKAATPEEKARRAAKRKENAHKYRGYEQKRRARLKNAIPKWYGEFDEFVMREAAELCDRRERATGIPWDVDHMIPMLARRASGLHCATNVQVIPTLLNRRKNNRMLLTEPLEWLAHV